MSTKSLGNMGEESAALYLKENGYTILARNLHIGHLEIDIIAKNDTHLVFVEVKTRRAYPGVPTKYGRPADAVDTKKQTHLMAAARMYLYEHRNEYEELIPNIDVLEVYVDPSAKIYRVLEIRHFKNAVNGMKGASAR